VFVPLNQTVVFHSDLNWSALNEDNIEDLKELYNEVMLTLNHGYQKSASMAGFAHQTTMPGLEGMAKITNGLVLLDGLGARTNSHRSTLRLAATIASRAPSCGWLLQC